MNEAKILALKTALKRRAAAKFPNDEKRRRAYVYGTIRRIKDKGQ